MPIPLELIPFPTDRKDPGLRAKWIKLVKRQLKAGINWTPDNDRLKHFEISNPISTLHLGYDLTIPVKLRQPPKRQALTHEQTYKYQDFS